MEIFCTRPGCLKPHNVFPELNDRSILTKIEQKYCTSCGMPLILGGHYLPIRLLGQGGFGTAFLARDRYTPSLRQCVLKQFQPTGNLSQQILEKALDLFEREAMVLDTLGRRHEQIPELFAFFPLIVRSRSGKTEEQYFYLAQEYIDGENLEQELQQHGAFSDDQIRHLLKEILKILVFVHEHGTIHRDIKPSNIMRDRNGRLFLLDFGAVKQVTVTAAQTGQSQPSTGIYSMGFAPPEQMQGAEIYPCTDLYALAVTCVNLLTAKPPEELYDTFKGCWDWRSHAPQVSDELASILEKMLETIPQNRFQSAQEVLSALDPTITPHLNPLPTPVPSSASISKSPRFTLTEVLLAAAFTGFEGALIVIILMNLLALPGIVIGLILIGGLIFLQNRRIVGGKELPITTIITVILMLTLPTLRGNLSLIGVLFIATLAGCATVAISSIFRLIYQLLSRFF